MLMTHAVKGIVEHDRSSLRLVECPEEAPWATDESNHWWQGIQHGELVDCVHDEATRRGLKATGERWVTDRSGLVLWGSVDFALPRANTKAFQRLNVEVPEGMQMSLGVRHSNNGHYALTFGSGAKVFVCDNGVITAEHVLKRKHSRHVDLPDIVADGFGLYLDDARRLGDFVETMQARDLSSQKEVDHLLVEAGRRDVIGWGKLRYVDRHWREPQHPEFEDRNGWSLYNAFTEVAKTCSVSRQVKLLNGARDLILN